MFKSILGSHRSMLHQPTDDDGGTPRNTGSTEKNKEIEGEMRQMQMQ
jgi:hypothetical protein